MEELGTVSWVRSERKNFLETCSTSFYSSSNWKWIRLVSFNSTYNGGMQQFQDLIIPLTHSSYTTKSCEVSYKNRFIVQYSPFQFISDIKHINICISTNTMLCQFLSSQNLKYCRLLL